MRNRNKKKGFTPPLSRRQKAIIHIAKQRCGLDDEAYRDLLQRAAGVRSASDLDQLDYRRVLAEFARLGFVPRHRSGRPGTTDPAPDREPQLKKIGALLAELGLPWAYADGMAKQMFKVAAVNWLDADQLQKMTAALNYHLKRRRKQDADNN